MFGSSSDLLEFENGIEFYVGWPGSGKTFYNHLDLVSDDNFDAIKIGNYTSPDFHIQYRSIKDLLTVLDRVYRSRLDEANQTCPVLIVNDEALLYLDSTKFKELPEAFNAFLIQLRKMGVRIRCICPRVSFITSKFRKINTKVTMFGEMRDPPTSRDWFVTKKVYSPADENAAEDDPRNFVISQTRVLHPSKRVKLNRFMRKYFPNSSRFQNLRYKTHEVIRIDFDVLDEAKLATVFPITKDFPDADSYMKYVWESMQEYMDDIRATEAQETVSRYERVYRGLPISLPDGDQRGESDPAAGVAPAVPTAAPSASRDVLFYEPDPVTEPQSSSSDSGGHPPGSTETELVRARNP